MLPEISALALLVVSACSSVEGVPSESPANSEGVGSGSGGSAQLVRSGGRSEGGGSGQAGPKGGAELGGDYLGAGNQGQPGGVRAEESATHVARDGGMVSRGEAGGMSGLSAGGAGGNRAPSASGGGKSVGAGAGPSVAGRGAGGRPGGFGGGSASGGGGVRAGEGGHGAATSVGRGGASPSAAVGTGGTGAAPDAGSVLLPVSVHIVGDSTVQTYTLDPANSKSQAGWGQMLQEHYGKNVTVINDAIGGRTARRFIQEGRLDAIMAVIKAGDYLLIQFGTNDSNKTATYTLDGVTYPYYAAPDTDFKAYLREYIDAALSKKAIPVLVTPPPRNSAYCGGGRSMGDYGQAMIDLGATEQVAVVDLGLATHSYLSALCPKPTSGSQESFFKVNADGSIDGTHFQENGARVMADFVADGIDECGLGLSAYRVR